MSHATMTNPRNVDKPHYTSINYCRCHATAIQSRSPDSAIKLSEWREAFWVNLAQTGAQLSVADIQSRGKTLEKQYPASNLHGTITTAGFYPAHHHELIYAEVLPLWTLYNRIVSWIRSFSGECNKWLLDIIWGGKNKGSHLSTFDSFLCQYRGATHSKLSRICAVMSVTQVISKNIECHDFKRQIAWS